MKRLLISLSLSFCVLLTACDPPVTEDRRAETGRLVLLALNAEFLWDGVAPEEGKIDFEWKGSQAKAEAHMADIAEIIRAHDPDLVHLSEVENPRALETFNDKFLPDSGYLPYLVPGTDTATGQDVALLSRIEVEKIYRDPRPGFSDGKRKSVSKHYIATLRAGDLRLGLVGLHFLAGPMKQHRIDDREAQADAVRRMARELVDKGREVIVWGDFNDFDGRTLDRSNNRPITRVLEWIRDLDPDDPSDDLFNVAERLPRQQRYTIGRDSIDHILVSQALAQRIVDVEIARDHDPRRVTNHYPVIVEFELGLQE